MAKSLQVLPAVLAVSLAACGSESPTSPTADDPGVITAVAVTCTAADSTGQQCRASAQLSNGAVQDVTASSTWTSSNSAVATVDAAGRVTHVGSGQTEIRATYQDRFGGAIVLVSVTVTSVSVTCTPESGAHACTAMAALSNGVVQDVTRAGAAWSSSNPNVGTVDATGRVTHRANGQVEIAARFQSVVGGAVISVSGVVTLTSVSVTCAPQVEAHQCAAIANRSDGSTQNVTANAAWTSSNTTVATVDSSGRVRHINSGQVEIRAVYQAITGSSVLDIVIPFGTSVVINEFALRAVEDCCFQDYLELRNDSPSAVDISGWRVQEWRTTGSIETRFTVGSGIVLMPGCHYLAAVSPTVAGVTRDAQIGFLDPNGGIALMRADGSIVDQVGMNVNSPFREGTALASAIGDVNWAYTRIGNDTNDNASDFVQRSRTPMNSTSSCAVR